VPLSLETLQIILPYSLALAAVGLLESLMTARLVDDITETGSDKDREARGQGIANVITGFFGGMPGCAMIGRTMINVRVSGARTRISTFCAGLFLLILVVALGDLVAIIPMAALVAVMIRVSISTFDWHSPRARVDRLLPRARLGPRPSPRWTPSSSTPHGTAAPLRSPVSTIPAPSCTRRSPDRWRPLTDGHADRRRDAQLKPLGFTRQADARASPRTAPRRAGARRGAPTTR
jgi:hypothetical protein